MNFPPRSSNKRKTLQITAASCSDIGRVREQNEDALALTDPWHEQAAQQYGYLYLLADGAGGHAAGEVASRVAVKTIFTVYYDQQEKGIPPDRLLRAFELAHTRIRQLASEHQEYAGMITTCIAAVIEDTRLWIAHVGDSRAYLLPTGSTAAPTMTCLTTDHSVAVAMAIARGQPLEQARSAPTRHMLYRALGGEEHMAPIIARMPPQQACTTLVQQANEAGGNDNISLIVLSFSERAG
jgi:PPM family protein phosphatase